MTTYSSIPAWEISWIAEPGGLQYIIDTFMKHKAYQILIMLNKEVPDSFYVVYLIGPDIIQHFITSDKTTGISKVGFV